jgi:inhibitor of KinA
MKDFRLVRAGDSTLVLDFEERIDPAVNARVIRLGEAVAAARIPGVRDIVPTFRSLAVFFDPLRLDYAQLTDCIEAHAEPPPETDTERRTPLRVPVCYGGDFGPDLDGIAEFAKMSAADVISLHAGAIYRVYMMGFLPGFAYLGIVDQRIAAPRRSMPRVRVPRGSVGIAGPQTGIYPADSPGGWQIIGRSPLRPFDISRTAAFLFELGDAVQFVPVDRAEYDHLASLDR